MIFEVLSYSLIILDTIVLCFDSISLTNFELKVLNIIDFVCLIYFFIEVLIRLSSHGKKFFKNLTNFLDIFLFVLNLSSLIYLKTQDLDIFGDFNDNFYSYYALIRSFQIARIYRLLISKKLWLGIATMALEMIKILKKVLNFLVLLVLFLLIMSLIGRDLFINAQINKNLENQIISEEIQRMNMSNILRSVMTNFMLFYDEDWFIIMINHMKAYGTGYLFYFILNILISTMFLNKFFLALLINKLIESKDMRSLIEETNPFSKLKVLYSLYSQKLFDFFRNKPKLNKDFIIVVPHVGSFERFKQYVKFFMNKNSKGFDKFMFLVCFFSLILVALNDPFQSNDSPYNSILRFWDIPVFTIFIFELFVLFLTEKKGLFSENTLFRLGICVIYLINFFDDIKILKLFVIFRFIMIIQFYNGLKRAVQALVYSLWDIFQLLIFFYLFILLFAAIGVKLFKGALYACGNIDEETLSIINTKSDCMDYGGDWVNNDFNFDDIFKAVDLLFVVANSSGWLSIM